MQRCGRRVFRKEEVQIQRSQDRNRLSALRKQKKSHMTRAEKLRGRE